ncbi:dnaJ homolog subfamily C member 24 [Mugil cephalus]|uniref:dnaJ homolog subfamily C member 24 n=1 Tax=Mugil cephalus TaxID=48193 RepID=UPI001FB74B90|nr:dnaJ homolog subfamily C member 24 [Mugil cephalus]
MCETRDKDLYAVLGASPSDSVQQIRHRYQQLVLQFHPDRLGGECSSESASSMKFLEVDAAWKILKDQKTRREYDLKRREQELRQDWPEDSTVYLEDMAWNKDEQVYTHYCRCGGRFCVTKEEVEGAKIAQQDDEEEESKEGQHRGVIVCCDTCSLSVQCHMAV